MIGSETFIIVALRCTENSTPSALARAICAVRNASRAAARMTVASTTSPSRTVRPSLRTVVPWAPTSWMVRVSAPGMTTDCSLERKSSWPMVATFVAESGDHAPMECGCRRA